MRLFRRTGLAALCGLTAALLTGCPDKTAQAPVDGGVTSATAAPDSGPEAVVFTLQYLSPDGGTALIPLALEEKPLVEPTSDLELRSTLGLKNYRVRLMDEADRAMVSDDSVSEADDGLVYRIHLPQPLKTGYSYTLVVDSQTGTSFQDSIGRDVEDLRASFQIIGDKEKPKPPPPPAKGGKKKSR
ncbi:hypothetical protein [Corallococcus exiguus]|uniref:Lipoprotein n=1 Tax=Corallococcus exiguus TaxID=83462 RepID=A0A7X4Y977_9BACT|nr:hypothetical protein [Corallococcus exiguus]NBC40414.1 hypothetical protein [Corallococcus exiguus]TNV55447.1 hypothetical protein FH620_31530 [Corallococcus exiguus]